jgi:hypothetical protein
MISPILLDKAIRLLNPSIVTLNGDIAYDQDGNEVAYDKSAAEAEAIKEQA